MAGDPMVAQDMHVHAREGAGYPVSDRCGRAADLASAAGRHADQDADTERHCDRQQWALFGFLGNAGERRAPVSRGIFAEGRRPVADRACAPAKTLGPAGQSRCDRLDKAVGGFARTSSDRPAK